MTFTFLNDWWTLGNDFIGKSHPSINLSLGLEKLGGKFGWSEVGEDLQLLLQPLELFTFFRIDLTVFKNYSKCRILKNSPKRTIFGIFNELLSTQNVNVARFARNVECDFFCDFQTLCFWWLLENLLKFHNELIIILSAKLSRLS